MSSRSRQPPGPTRRAGWGQLLLIWIIAEAIALALVVRLVGVGGALLIGLGTSVVGVVLTRRLGQSAAAHLRAATRGGPVAFVGPGLSDGLLQAGGALLLILPGFLSDVAGLLLLFAPVRGVVRTWLARRGRGAGRPAARRPGEVVDLAPEDWRRD